MNRYEQILEHAKIHMQKSKLGVCTVASTSSYVNAVISPKVSKVLVREALNHGIQTGELVRQRNLHLGLLGVHRNAYVYSIPATLEEYLLNISRIISDKPEVTSTTHEDEVSQICMDLASVRKFLGFKKEDVYEYIDPADTPCVVNKVNVALVDACSSGKLVWSGVTDRFYLCEDRLVCYDV